MTTPAGRRPAQPKTQGPRQSGEGHSEATRVPGGPGGRRAYQGSSEPAGATAVPDRMAGRSQNLGGAGRRDT